MQPTISPQELQRLRTMLSEARNVVLTCHQSPDGDAIGSCLAMQEWLTRKGKQVHVIVPNLFPDFLKWMTHAEDIIIYGRNYALSRQLLMMADLVVALDYNDPSRLNELGDLVLRSKARKLLIDHHEQPKHFCDLEISRPKMSSTCELLFRLLNQLGEERNISKACAEDLYAGMCTDTGKFTYNSNDPDTFVVISQLMRKGIDKDCIIRNLYNQQREGRLRLMGYMLSEKLIVWPELHASLFAITKEEQERFAYMKGDAEGFVNIPLEIKGMKLSISLRDDTEKGEVSVSIRSVDDFSAVDVAKRFFNGGGHFNAAGGRLACSMNEAIEIAKQAIEAYREQLMA